MLVAVFARRFSVARDLAGAGSGGGSFSGVDWGADLMALGVVAAMLAGCDDDGGGGNWKDEALRRFSASLCCAIRS